MVKKGDDWKDLKLFLEFRIKHLTLERQKIPYTMKDVQMRERAIKKLSSKIQELRYVRKIVAGDIKEASKYEYMKVAHLEEMKVNKLRDSLKDVKMDDN